METPTLHMHTLKIAIVDPAGVPGGWSFELAKQVLAERLHLLPAFRRRIVPVPLALDHPVWVEDEHFDLDNHLRQAHVDAPGGRRELCRLISRIASAQLDRNRPLWEVWVVDGLEHGHLAFVGKIHHTLADGVAAAEMLMNILEVDELPVPVSPPTAAWQPEPVPSRGTLVIEALRNRLRQLRGLPALLRRTLAGLRKVSERRKSSEVSPPLPFSTPNTSFNTSLTRNRTFAMATMSLSDAKAVKAAFDVTLNDVVLAAVAGALRHYLETRGELPARPLVAGVPVSTQAEADKGRLVGNKVSNMFTSLRTDLPDPVERLRAIHEVTTAAKEVHRALGSEMLADWSDLTPPGPFAAFMRLYSRLRLADRHRPPINLVVSNVPGPRTPLHVAGSKLVGIFSVGPILEGIGLNITVWSYLDDLNVGVIACPEAMPDIWALAEALPEALAELAKAAAAT